MAPLEEIEKYNLMELVDTLRPFIHQSEKVRLLVEKWDYAFEVWGWVKKEDYNGK